MTDPQVRAALTDRQLLALTIWGEARGESLRGQQAVAAVIRNRTKAGKGYRDVILAPKQFSCWNEDDSANHHSLMIFARQLTGCEPQHGVLKAPFLTAMRVADQCIGGEMADPVDGATHYVTVALLNTHPPKWLATMKLTQIIGGHAFFKVNDAPQL